MDARAAFPFHISASRALAAVNKLRNGLGQAPTILGRGQKRTQTDTNEDCGALKLESHKPTSVSVRQCPSVSASRISSMSKGAVRADHRLPTLYLAKISRTRSSGIASVVRPRAVTLVAMKIEL